jgi:hypothetical protein
LGSSIPLIENDLLIGTVTLYSAAGIEIGLEQRMLIQALAPALAKAVASAAAHDEIAAIDGTNQHEREVLYTVMDALLSSRAKWPDRNHPDRLTIVRVRWHVNFGVNKQNESMSATLERAIASATNNSGHVVRLSANDLVVVAAQKHLVSAGLGLSSPDRVSRPTDIDVTEISNSLQLREALGLTAISESQAISGRPLIH